MAARNDFDRHLAKEPLLPVYALIGAETMLVHEAVHTLRSRVLTVAPDFNRTELRGNEATGARIVDAVRTLPMMAPKRWVLVTDLERLKADEAEPLLELVTKPIPTTVLVLTGAKLDQRTKLGQRLSGAGALFTFEPPRQQDLPMWIGRRAQGRGFDVEPEAARLLADLVGVDLGGIDRALEKASLHAGSEASVTVEDIEATVAPTRLASIFELTDAVGSRKLAEASLVLRNTLAGGESALMVLGMVARQLRQLVTTKAVGDEGTAAIARELGVRPFVAELLQKQAKRYTSEELYRALEALRRADLRIKSSKLDPGVVLDGALVEIMGSAPATAPAKEQRGR